MKQTYLDTARTYLMLAKSIKSEYYLSKAKQQIKLYKRSK